MINANMIYNIFSNFGNIYKLIFYKNESYANIEFETKFYATFAKEYM